MLIEHARAGGRQSVRTSSIGRRDRFYPALTFQSSKRLVEAAWGNAYTSKLLNILGQGIAVLFSIGQAGENQIGHTGDTSGILAGRFRHQSMTISVTDTTCQESRIP